jgi:ABC-type polysaccharide/polyol phosphate export permease
VARWLRADRGGLDGALGIVAAILSQKFDHIAAITNFVVTPLSFLSGTFYSIERCRPRCRRSPT